MDIRNCQPGDEQALSEIYLQSRRAAFHWLDTSAYALADFLPHTAGEVILVAAVDGKIVGFSSSWMAENFIHHLYVDPQHLGQGIGGALLNATVAMLGRPARLKCLTHNAHALAFYQARGWVIAGEDIGEDGPYCAMELPA